MTVGLRKLLFLLASAATLGLAQTDRPLAPFEILSFKIVSYYNPLLEASAPTGADNRDLPRTPAEKVANAQRTTARSPQERANEIGVPPGAAPRIKHLSPAEWVYFTVRNTSDKAIKSLVWEFAFLRMEQGKLALWQTVTSPSEIKPNAKKTLRQPLPPGASRCKVVQVRPETAADGKATTQEYVCGRGFADPSLLKEKPEPVGVQRIEYADGTSWQRP